MKTSHDFCALCDRPVRVVEFHGPLLCRICTRQASDLLDTLEDAYFGQGPGWHIDYTCPENPALVRTDAVMLFDTDDAAADFVRRVFQNRRRGRDRHS